MKVSIYSKEKMMKKVGILSAALALTFAMSSSFAFFGHGKSIEIKDIAAGQTRTATLKAMEGSTIVCQAPKITAGSVTIVGFDRDIVLKAGALESRAMFLGTGAGAAAGNPRAGAPNAGAAAGAGAGAAIKAVASPDLKFAGMSHTITCKAEKSKM
jgi:hypothetical protein